MAGRLGEWWCGLMHNAPMWPIRGSYRCRTCGLSYPVSWDGEHLLQAARLVIRKGERVVKSGA